MGTNELASHLHVTVQASAPVAGCLVGLSSFSSDVPNNRRDHSHSVLQPLPFASYSFHYSLFIKAVTLNYLLNTMFTASRS